MIEKRPSYVRNISFADIMLPMRKMLCIFALFLLAFSIVPVTEASAETRKLKMHFMHTGEHINVAYKRNGKYLPGGLKKINRFLRDWRRNEPTKMDPKLLDLIWEVYQEAGGRKPIHVVSAYRSQKTNNLLRKRGRGVAKKSQHSLGKALDFFIPGVKLSKLRAVGLRKGIGGVGYYPKSGSPFVHMDTGRVRHWPRMTRKQLVRVFPKGRTLHVPTDGKPLPGYNIAKARYEKATRGKIVVAKRDDIEKKPNFFAKLLGRDDEGDGVNVATAPKPAPAVRAPVPAGAVPTAQPSFEQPSANVIASLAPTGPVPIPLLAPRVGGTVSAAPGATIVDPVNPTAEDLLQEQQIASAVPIPVRATRQAAPVDAVALVADAEPLLQNQTLQNTQTQVAALSANEIADLRQQVIQTIKTPRTDIVQQAPKPFAPPRVNLGTRLGGVAPKRPSFGVPRPAAAVPGSGQGGPAVVSNGSVGSVQDANTNLVGYAETETIVGGNGITVTPVRNPNRLTQTAINSQLTQTPEVTTEAVKDTTAPSVEISPVAPKIESTEPSIPQTSIVANVPVPTKNPQRAISLARAQASPDPVKPVTTAVNKPDTRELTATEIETANLNERLVGKWAFASDASIADIADIKPPAYSSNIARQRPNSVLSSGFTQERIRGFTQGFSGASTALPSFTTVD